MVLKNIFLKNAVSAKKIIFLHNFFVVGQVCHNSNQWESFSIWNLGACAIYIDPEFV